MKAVHKPEKLVMTMMPVPSMMSLMPIVIVQELSKIVITMVFAMQRMIQMATVQ